MQLIWLLGPLTVSGGDWNFPVQISRFQSIPEVLSFEPAEPPSLIVSAVSLPYGANSTLADGVELMRELHRIYPDALKWLWTHHSIPTESPILAGSGVSRIVSEVVGTQVRVALGLTPTLENSFLQGD